MPAKKSIDFRVTDKGCFEVTSHALNTWGYPRVGMYGIEYGAHRFIWEECFGFIPEGMQVLHHCDNPSCINPEHLFLGTHDDNMADKANKGRAPRGERNYQTKLNLEKIKAIRSRYYPRDKKNGMNAMAREYGVDPAAIGSIIHRKTWRYV